MADLRTRNNASSKKSYEKSVERQYADDYEHEMVRQHILTTPDTDAYHWSMVPEEYLYESGYISDFNKHRLERLMRKKEKKEGENRVRDYGFDGLARTRIGSSVIFNGLQAKYYIHKQVCASDIGSFFAMQISLTLKNLLSKGFLYTTSSLQADLAGNVANPSYPIRHVLHLWKHPDARTTPTVPPVQQDCDKLLRADQIDALKQLEDKEGINALNTPCRWGKTIVAGHHTKRINAKLVVTIAPLLVSVENLQDRLACFLPGYSPLLVDSDTGGTTNIEEIKKFLASEGNHIIYSTFKSAVDILSDLLKDFENTFVLGDEIHNANTQLCEFIQQFPKGLVMSATMPEEIVNLLDINYTVYIPFAQAIKDGIVVDYTLWLPQLIKASDGITSVDIEIPVEFSTYDSDLTAKAFYLATVMLKTGSRRCITYLGRQEDCDRFVEVVAQIFEIYHGLTIWTGKIDSTISKAKRKEVLDAFQTGQNDVYHILTSVRILDEAVDIPRCDSVFITNVGEHSSDIRMMQRSQRSSTKDPKNPSKHNNIILWADGWEKCVGALDLLREADPEFHKKVRIADCNYDKSGEVARIKSVKEEAIEFGKWEAMKCLTMWERHVLRIKEIKEFYAINGKEPNQRGSRENEKTLANYISCRRREYKEGKLKEMVIALINESWKPWFIWIVEDTHHENMIKACCEFVAKYKEPPKTAGKREDETQLAGYIAHRREDKRLGRLTQELEKLIMDNCSSWWIWNTIDHIYTTNIIELEKFYNIYKEAPIHGGERTPNETQLARCIGTWRGNKKKGILQEEYEKLITGKLPWISWDPLYECNIKNIAAIKDFYNRYKEPPKSKGERDRNNEGKLATFMIKKRTEHNDGTISKEYKDLINKEWVPWFVWDPSHTNHIAKITEVEAFIAKYDCLPNSKGTRDDGNEKILGCYLITIRGGKKSGTLSAAIIKLVEEKLPLFSWGGKTEERNTLLKNIASFYTTYSEEPKQHGVRENGNEAKMAAYLSQRRNNKKKGTLSEEIEKQINKALPWFQWGTIYEHVLPHIRNTAAPATTYETMSKAQLIEQCKEKKIVFSHKTKIQLVESLSKLNNMITHKK